MAAPKPLKFVTGPNIHYAKRKTNDEWSTHKDEIIEQFGANGLEHTRRWMRDNHGFDATRGQYEHKLHVLWKVPRRKHRQKTLRQELDNSSLFGSSLTHNLQQNAIEALSLAREGSNPSRAITPETTANETVDCAQSGDELNLQSHENNPKRIRSGSPHGDLASHSRKRQRTSFPEIQALRLTISLPANSGALVPVQTTQENTPPDTQRSPEILQDCVSQSNGAHSLSLASMQNLVTGSDKSTNQINRRESGASIHSLLSQQNDGSTPVESENEEAESRSSGENIGLLYTLEKTCVIDLAYPIDSYSWEDIKRIHAVADLLFVLSMFQECFGLYILVWKKLASISETDEIKHNSYITGGHYMRSRLRQLVVVSCVCSAKTPTNLEIAKILLLKEFRARKVRDLAHFMRQMQVLLIEIQQSPQDQEAAIVKYLKAIRKLTLEDYTPLELGPPGPPFGFSLPEVTYELLTFRYLFRCIQGTIKMFRRDLYNVEKILYEPRWERSHMEKNYAGTIFYYIRAACGDWEPRRQVDTPSSCVRNCVRWCVQQMYPSRSAIGVPQHLVLLEEWSIKKLFCHLHSRWLRGTDDWSYDVEMHIGISATELLCLIMALAIDNGGPVTVLKDSTPGSARIAQTSRWHYISLFQSLLDLSLEELAESLTHVFLRHDYMKIMSNDCFTEHGRLEFVETCLNVKLPDRMTDIDIDLDLDNIGPSNQNSWKTLRQRAPSFSPSMPMSVPSLALSGWSSFRSTAARANAKKKLASVSSSLGLSALYRRSWSIRTSSSFEAPVDDISERMSQLELTSATLSEHHS